jgi:regulator of RNase E activity RraA
MYTKYLALSLLLFGADCALAQAADLPARMQGSWKTPTKNGDSTIELIAMTSPDKAKVKVTLTGGTISPPHGGSCLFGTVETVAERTGDTWLIVASHMRCATYTITIKPVEGKQRYEGTVVHDFFYTGLAGVIFYEW